MNYYILSLLILLHFFVTIGPIVISLKVLIVLIKYDNHFDKSCVVLDRKLDLTIFCVGEGPVLVEINIIGI